MTRRYYHILLISAFIGLLGAPRILCAQEQPNIIFIIADDLNDFIEGYDAAPNTFTPNLNLLREQGTTFLNAYASAPICAPSRTSFMTGKDVYYTQVFKGADGDYKCKEFSDNFTAAEGNEVYFTLPQYLKDSLGYYTFNLNKVFHCHKNFLEYDELTADPCSKSGAWNRYMYYYDSAYIEGVGTALDQGVDGYAWAAIPDSLEYHMTDYVATDSVIDFIEQYAADPGSACDKPFMIMLGYHKPHKDQFIPEKYFLSDYITDFYTSPLDLPFNFPINTFPPNGIILPPQPDTPFADIESLLINSISALMVKTVDSQFMEWPEELDVLPEVDPTMTDAERITFLQWAQRANGVMAYLAAVQYIDAQFGRIYENLQAHPDIRDNTIIVFVGDNGYALSEKHHWGKYALWDTDVRVPLIIADLRDPVQQVSNRTVSLMDLFPTMIDLAGGNVYPTFPDGSAYFDGRSLLPLLSNPDTIWNRPVISTTKKQNSEMEASCFPQYSVRDERFHLIRYITNGTPDGICDSALSSYQYELYELGVHREVDPYEWNNLAYDSNYQIVVNYLEQWLPGNALYNSPSYTVQAETNITSCLLTQGDVFYPTCTLIDAQGVVVADVSGFVFQWTNNLTADTLYGIAPTVDLSTIPEAVFDANDQMLLYLQVLDTAGSSVLAMDLEYIHLSEAGVPEISYHVVPYGPTGVVINDFEIAGAYTDFWWDFGAGPQFYNTVPGPYYYDVPGPYMVSCYAQYGNMMDCIASVSVSSDPSQLLSDDFGNLVIWPNPTAGYINIMCDVPVSGKTYTIFNATGQIVGRHVQSSAQVIDKIDVSYLPQGLYHIALGSHDLAISGSFVVVR